MKALLLMLAVGALSAQPALASSTWRCGSALVSVGDAGYEVIEKCGEPIDRAFVGYAERSDIYGFRSEVPLEEWVYGPKSGMYYYLQFEANRLKNISSRRRN